MPVRFDQPALLWLLLLLPLVVGLGVRSLAALDPARRIAAIAVRGVVLLTLIFMLAGAQAVRRHDTLVVMAVLDESESVQRFVEPPALPDAPERPTDLREWMTRYLRLASKEQKPDDELGLVTFDGRPTVASLPAPGSSIDAAASVTPVEGSDIASALRLAMAADAAGSSMRLVLASDGNDRSGGGGQELLAAAREAAAAGVAIDVVPLTYRVDREVVVEGLYAPSEARKGQTLPLRVVLSATRPTKGRLYLTRDGEPVDLNGSQEGLALAVGENAWTLATGDEQQAVEPTPGGETGGEAGGEAGGVVDKGMEIGLQVAGRFLSVQRLELPTLVGGASRFAAVFEADDAGADLIAVNNKAQGITMVHGQGRVLIVDGVGGESGRILADALRRREIELDVVEPHAMPGDLLAMSRYDAVLLQNVSADEVPVPLQRVLVRYVNDLGGGLAMIGGPESFGAGAWTNSPVDAILPVRCEVPSQTVLPSGALVMVIDRSGSMSSPVGGTQYTQQELASEAAALAASTLFPQDMIGVVAFDDQATWIVPLQPNSDPKGVAKRIKSIQPGGGTNIFPGLVEAADALAKVNFGSTAVKHVIVLTDGHSAPGEYPKVVGGMVKGGVTLSTIGVGDGHDAALLQNLASMGGGSYHPIISPKQLPQVFVKEAKTIRRNLIRELAFNPQVRATASPVMEGLTQTPPLRGFVLTDRRADPRVYLPIVGPEGEPIFAHWQVGLGRTAAFTADATRRWASDWMNWNGYGDFWSRLVRHLSRSNAGAGMELISEVRGDRLRIRLDASAAGEALDAQGRATPVNPALLRVGGLVVAPDGSAKEVALEQTGPGVFEAELSATQSGSYLVNVFAAAPDGQPQAVFAGVHRPTGPELRDLRSNRAMLEEVARLTGGRVLDPSDPVAAGLFTRQGIKPSRSVRPLWRPMLIALIVLLIVDVAVRRIAWDPVLMVRRLRRAAEQPTDSAAVLAELQRRQKAQPGPDTRADVKFEPDRFAPGATPGATPRSSPGGTDLRSSLDAASDTPRLDAAAAASAHDPVDDEALTTSRLLAAKRRAQQRIDPHQQP